MEASLSEYRDIEAKLRDAENQISQMAIEIERLSNAVRAKG
jgi:hypothetical protein